MLFCKTNKPLLDFFNLGFTVLVQIALIFIRTVRENILHIFYVIHFLQALHKQRVKFIIPILGSIVPMPFVKLRQILIDG